MSNGPTSGKEITRIPQRTIECQELRAQERGTAAVRLQACQTHQRGAERSIAGRGHSPPTTTIMGAIKTMTFYGFSRLPIADAGTKRLLGFVTSVDVVDFLGGGFGTTFCRRSIRNIFTAINADIREI